MSIRPITDATPSVALPATTNKVAAFVQKNWPAIVLFTVCIAVVAYTFYTERKKNSIFIEKPSNKSFDELYCNLSKTDFDDTIKLLKGTSKSGAQKFLITGPKESGKSHIAKAVSHEASVPIIEIDCNDWIEAHVLSSRIENAFNASRKKPGCVILIKHVDALKPQDQCIVQGRRVQEKNMVWNLLEIELRKLKPDERTAVFVTAQDKNEPNLSDLGFDNRSIETSYPDEAQRKKILTDLLVGKTVNADLDTWASKWQGYSYLRIKNLVNIIADDKNSVTDSCFQSAMDQESTTEQKLIKEKLNHISGQGPGKFEFGSKFTLDQIAGNEDAKQKIKQIIDYLKYPKEWRSLNSEEAADSTEHAPRGVIFHGPPGTGKTALGLALANDANCSFLHVQGTLASKWVGEAANNVRKLFQQAKAATEVTNGPCILFMDEIDSIGQARSQRDDGSGSTAEELVTTFTSEDLSNWKFPIILIGATNRLDVIDEAFMRAGRFDLQIAVSFPARHERIQIFKIHAKKHRFAEGIDFEKYADLMMQKSGADLQELMHEAKRIAVMERSKLITNDHMFRAYSIKYMGSKITIARGQAQYRRTATHELGHALVAAKDAKEEGKGVIAVSILPRGTSWGVTYTKVEEGKSFTTDDYLRQIRILKAGQAAEEVIYKSYTGGCLDDLNKATQIAKLLVYKLGYGRRVAQFSNKFSDQIKQIYAEDIENIMQRELENARQIIKDNKELLLKIRVKLIKEEVLMGEDFIKLLPDSFFNVPQPELDDAQPEET